MLTPRISVVIPIYNGASFIGVCLQSILSQGFADMEVIIVDDGSTDSSPSLCDDFSSKYSQVRVIHQENGGVSRARNTGIDAAIGEYICFVDADDELLPHALENMWHCVEEHPCVDVVTAPITLSGHIISSSGYIVNFIDDRKCIRSHNIYELLGFSACSKLIRRQLLEDSNVHFVEGLSVGEDPLFVFCLHKHISSVAQCRETVYRYRENAASVMHESDSTKRGLGSLKAAVYASRHFDREASQIECVYILDLLSVTRLKQYWGSCDQKRIRQETKRCFQEIKRTNVPLVIKLAAWRLTWPYDVAVNKVIDVFIRCFCKINQSFILCSGKN